MKATNPKIFGLILAGGYSRRMGRDKALLEFHGKPQVEYLVNLLEMYCSSVFISKRKDQYFSKDYQSIDDDPGFADAGPLGGILSAMKAHPDVSWLVLACDLPFVSDETIRMLLNLRDPQKTATAFISSYDQLPEPLCAVWEGQAYEGIILLFKQGIHCPRKILIKSDTHLIKQDNPCWLDNINTPEELRVKFQ